MDISGNRIETRIKIEIEISCLVPEIKAYMCRRSDWNSAVPLSHCRCLDLRSVLLIKLLLTECVFVSLFGFCANL